MSIERTLLTGLAVGLALLLEAPFAHATPSAPQTTVQRHAELGLEFVLPRGYEARPVGGDEAGTLLVFRERSAEGIPSTLRFHQVDPEDAGTDDLGELVRIAYAQAELAEVRVARPRVGYQQCRFEGKLEDRALLVHGFKGDGRVILVEGTCDLARQAEQRRVWDSVISRLKVQAPRQAGSERERLERMYAAGRWSDAEHRIAVRLGLVDGWEAKDLKDFIVVHHDVDERFVRDLCGLIETIRRDFERVCSSVGGESRVSTVRVCKDRAEYLEYGGEAGTIGYFSPEQNELVLFDARNEAGDAELGERLTRAILVHEALHQHLYGALNRCEPDPWIDEGLAEYFAASDIQGSRRKGARVSEWRLGTIQSALRGGREWSLEELFELPREAFYADANQLYAQSWSLLYFLKESQAARRRPAWRGLVPRYLEALREAWEAERARAPIDTRARREVALGRAQARARAAALEGVDLEALTAAWREFVLGLEAPRPGD